MQTRTTDSQAAICLSARRFLVTTANGEGERVQRVIERVWEEERDKGEGEKEMEIEIEIERVRKRRHTNMNKRTKRKIEKKSKKDSERK